MTHDAFSLDLILAARLPIHDSHIIFFPRRLAQRHRTLHDGAMAGTHIQLASRPNHTEDRATDGNNVRLHPTCSEVVAKLATDMNQIHDRVGFRRGNSAIPEVPFLALVPQFHSPCHGEAPGPWFGSYSPDGNAQGEKSSDSGSLCRLWCCSVEV